MYVISGAQGSKNSMFRRLIPGNRDSKKDSSDLILRLSKGDNAAIEELYTLYFDRIYSLVYNQVGRDQCSAEEVVQETWLAVIKSAKKFKGTSQPYTWLCSIALHKIKDYQRRHYVDMAKLYRPSEDPEIAELQLIDSGPLPDEIIEKEETKEMVRRALSSLPSHYQQVLTLKYVEEMSAKEISQSLGKSTRSVESMLDRAKLALRNKIVESSK
jgi:RNA polymerase sigma-70 factor (ECF subfamily)